MSEKPNSRPGSKGSGWREAPRVTEDKTAAGGCTPQRSMDQVSGDAPEARPCPEPWREQEATVLTPGTPRSGGTSGRGGPRPRAESSGSFRSGGCRVSC